MRSTIVTAVVVTGLAASSPSSASPQPGVADIGSAAFTAVEVPPQAPCAIGGPSSATAERVSKPGITFGGGTSSCTDTKVTATGKDFELTALLRAGGPRVRLSSFTVTCERAPGQTSANWSYGGLSGIANPPSPVPVGYVSPLRKSDGKVLANAVFNIQNLPGDGSVGLTMLRIDFLPESGISGTVELGRTSCSPTP
jgi:hypothetical protein